MEIFTKANSMAPGELWNCVWVQQESLLIPNSVRVQFQALLVANWKYYLKESPRDRVN